MSDATVAFEYADQGPPPREVPAGIPGYEILEELGRGGMGVVYRARQRSLNRIVALKMLLGPGSGEGLERFKVEAEAIGQLQHANIVQVFEIGEADGAPFFTLEFCPQGNLSRRLDGRPMPNQDAAALIRELALAMETAHQAGIIHRDLKPANVLMAADGTPKVTDFGIAKTRSEGSSQTQTGTILGTPSYMAPEQALGMTKDVGPTADVYSLGAILYECLTGRPPFVAASTLETMRQVLEQEPLPPRFLNHAADSDLEKIALKCLQKQPTERYSSSSELAEDLRRYLEGEQITARSLNLFERMQRELNLDQHESKIHPWGGAIMWLGAIVFVTHVVTTSMLAAGVAEAWSFWGPRCGMLLVLAFWLKRFGQGKGLLPTNPLERMLWATWTGYLLAYVALNWVLLALGLGHLESYGPAMVLSGMAWFTVGGCVWGGCYVIGLLFLVAAPGMTLLNNTHWAPLAFGTAWGITLLTIGGRAVVRSRKQRQS